MYDDAKLSAVLVHGLRPATVTIADDHPSWPVRFERRAAELRAILGERARLIEHIGSTAVPGLAAKPIIDIVVGVDDPDDERERPGPLRGRQTRAGEAGMA
ncbi:GrpB family protein [Nonomuraea sp. NPDC050643]|uniref:GrpB family protein n=1 Tax=Nonomuraea sp. NPDC050643 TaxID=3155660 RepID=UPI0033F0D38C